MARYRSGGLLPEARTALLKVLADRGHAVKASEDQGVDEIATLRVNKMVEAHPAATKARPSLPTA